MKLRHRLFLGFLRFTLHHFFRIRVSGLQNYPRGHKSPLVIISNHQSLLDAPIVNAFLPERPTFAVNSVINRGLLVKLSKMLAGNKTFPIDQTNPLAIRALIRHLQEHPTQTSCIFPEGRLSPGGKLMKVYDGAGMVADKISAQLLPVHISGAHLSKLHLRFKPYPTFLRTPIEATFQPPVSLNVPPELRGRARRKFIAERVYDIMCESMFNALPKDELLFTAFLRTAEKFRNNRVAIRDLQFTDHTYGSLKLGAVVLGTRLKSFSQPGEALGFLLPTAAATAVAFLAAHYAGRVPAMLNYTAGAAGVLAGCRAAKVKTILTSRTFVEKAKLEPLIEALSPHTTIHYLEDIRASLTLAEKLGGKWHASRLSSRTFKNSQTPQSPAVILFTSGSEGSPKGVALSHGNLLANRAQMAARMDFNPADQVLNALPLFHSFGLTGGLLAPLLEGTPIFLYPSPLHVRMVPEMVYDVRATITFATDTFLAHYGRYAHPFDFESVRAVYAGAEKLRDETRTLWMEKFGVRILEGYGATEASPVISTNTIMRNRIGTVGQLMPGMQARLTPVEGIAQGGRLHIQGPNVMLGYLHEKGPGIIIPPASELGNGWYDTGDIVTLSDDNFITILGRAKRFAKIGGEMISLTAAEAFVSRHWPESQHAVLSVPDARKGEKLVLLTTDTTLTRAHLTHAAAADGIADLLIPREVHHLPKLMQLATGKPDYPALQKWLADHAQA
ncbi:MAG: AMP-binding protein [Proteobacteria bacterium]|nr:AMP-binding protein [Pseudomonadota bacterium]